MPSQNGIMGTEDYGLELPETQQDTEAIKELQNLVKYSKSKEFKRLKAHFEERIEYYQTYLPDGRAINTVPTAEAQAMWIPANVIIGELRAVISVYEQAEEALKELRKNA